MKKLVEEQNFIEYAILIRRIREVFKDDNSEEYKDKFYLVDIIQPNGYGVSFGIPIKRNNIGTALRKVIREIKRSLCL